MSARHRKAEAQRRILKVGGTYLDRSRGVLVTLEDHEIQGGRRTGRVIVCATDGVLRFPRRWYSHQVDLVEAPGAQATLPGVRP
jgi:hypothetical protein